MASQIDSGLSPVPSGAPLSPTQPDQEFNHQLARGAAEATPPVGISLLMSSLLDCEILTGQLARSGSARVLDASDNLEESILRITTQRPQIVIFDPRIHLQHVDRILSLVENRIFEHLIVLDNQVRDILLLRILETPRTSYLTRQSGISSIHRAVHSVAVHSQRVFDPFIQRRILQTPAGLRLTTIPSKEPVSTLTQRELDVLKLVALGLTVRDCASRLNVSTSTVDNHKARLMKKLKIHKVPMLTRLAIREGLISA